MTANIGQTQKPDSRLKLHCDPPDRAGALG
jgi:hypothetical protein